MNTIKQFLFFIGYIFAVGPPRAMDLQNREDKSGGELANQPIGILLVLELGMRLVLLMCCAVALEEFIGKGVYEVLQLEILFSVLGVCGVAHTLAYFVFLVVPKIRKRSSYEKLYRFARNISYSPLPGFTVVAFVLLWEMVHGYEFFETNYPLEFYFLTTTAMLVASVAETFISKRTPLGLDQTYKADFYD